MRGEDDYERGPHRALVKPCAAGIGIAGILTLVARLT